MENTNEMTIIFDSYSSNEAFARVAVAAFMTSLNPTVEEVADVKTAVSEAVTNAIIHGYESRIEKITLRCKTCGDTLYIEIEDHGKGMEDVKKAMEPLFTTRPELDRSGMGFSFMEAFMDQVEVSSKPGKGTIVKMQKTIGKGRKVWTTQGVTITALVPAMVTVCMEMLEWDEDYDISSLRILQVGGAMLEDSLADKIIEEWPCKLMQVFGTAEGLLSFTSPEDEGSLIARCQGTPVSPADEVKIVDEEDKAVPEGVFGELLSRGPYTIDGYYMAEEANKKSFTSDGFYRTGDKAMWTKDGRLRLGGRIKEQINRAGEKIMPSEIEAYLCRHSKIKEAAVVGVTDETLGNRICAFLVTDDEAGIDLQEIHRFLREIGVAAYKMPDQIERVETWPLTSVGKIDKKALERMAQEK